MTDFTYLGVWGWGRRDGELVVKELAVADSRSNRVSSCEEVSMFNGRMNQIMDH